MIPHRLKYTIHDYKFNWRRYPVSMALVHGVAIFFILFLLLFHLYQEGAVDAIWPGVPLAFAVACALLATLTS